MPRDVSNSLSLTNKVPLSIRSLKGDRAFQRLRKGRPGHAKFLSIRYLPTHNGQVHVGIVVSKKVGNAVVRNRVRRRLREALRALLNERTLPVSCDLVIVTRPEAAAADYWQLKSALERALSKSGLLA